jgi:hypothetical protein
MDASSQPPQWMVPGLLRRYLAEHSAVLVVLSTHSLDPPPIAPLYSITPQWDVLRSRLP